MYLQDFKAYLSDRKIGALVETCYAADIHRKFGTVYCVEAAASTGDCDRENAVPMSQTFHDQKKLEQ